jgi:hypothetical protein
MIPAPLDPASELRARAALLIAFLMRNPDDEGIAPCASRLDELIDGEGDVNVRVMAASVLLNYINWNTDGSTSASLIARIEPVRRNPEVHPAHAAMVVLALRALALHQRALCRIDRSHEEARAVAERLRARDTPLRHRPPGRRLRSSTRAITQPAKMRLDIIERRLSPAQRCTGPTFFTSVRSWSNASATPKPRPITPNERSPWPR